MRDFDELADAGDDKRTADREQRALEQHNTWSWGCAVPTDERANGDALDALAVCSICEPKTPDAQSGN